MTDLDELFTDVDFQDEPWFIKWRAERNNISDIFVELQLKAEPPISDL